MKVIFLDVDGVLNCESTEESIDGWTFVEDVMVDRVVNIVERTGATIVLSSDWRMWWDSISTKALRDKFAEKGVYVIERTPEYPYRDDLTRNKEINAYRGLHPEITHYVILDDYWTFVGQNRKHFVKTNYLTGITDEDALRAINILNEGD